MTVLNASEHVSKDEVYLEYAVKGFQEGASHVHTIVGLMLFTWILEAFLYFLVKTRPELFTDAEEFYTRVSRSLETGRVVMALVIYFQTVFTFTTTVPGAVGP